MKKIILSSVSVIVLTILSAFQIYYTSGCPYHSGSPADGLTCASCHTGGVTTPSVAVTSVPAFGLGNTYIPGATYTISVIGQGYNLFGFDLEILNSSSTAGSSVLDFGTINSLSSNETVNTPAMGNGYSYSDIMHTAPNSSPFKLEWTAPLSGTGYLYCALLGINNNGNTSGDKSCVISMTLNPSINTNTTKIEDNLNIFDVYIYPNPCHGILNISFELNETKILDIELWNVLGNKLGDVFHGENLKGKQNIQYPISSYLPKGTYILKITCDKNSLSKKVILK